MSLLGKTKQEVVTEFRCKEIIEAARHVFAEKGFHRATVEQIAEAAGIAKGTVYLYFQTKREIYVETLRRGVLAFHEEVRTLVNRESSPRECLRAFIRGSLEYFDRNQAFFKIYHTEFGSFFAEPGSTYKECIRIYGEQTEMLQSVLDRGVKQGLVRPLRTSAAAQSIHAVTRAIVTQRLLGASGSGLEEDTEFVFDLIWRGVAAR